VIPLSSGGAQNGGHSKEKKVERAPVLGTAQCGLLF